MELKRYYLGLDFAQRERFCIEAKTTDGYMTQLINGHRKAGPLLARRLSVASGGLVPLEKIRPDIWGSDFAA